MHRLAALALAGALGLVGAACGEQEAGPPLSPEAARGRQVAQERGCLGCHTTSGSSKSAPTFKGLHGSVVELADGTMVRADDAYLTRAITDPGADLVRGFPNPMPAYDLPADDLAALLAYLRAIGTTASG